MKRNILVAVILSMICCWAHAQNNDVHLQRLVQCVNEGNYICATEQMELVQDWKVIRTDSIDVDKALQLVKYAKSQQVSQSLIDYLNVFIEQVCFRKGTEYEDNGNYRAAIPYYEKSVSIRKEILGTNHPKYAFSLSILGNAYDYIGKSKKAEPLLLEALKIYKKSPQINYAKYAGALQDLGYFYSKQKNYKKAEYYLLKNSEVCEEYLGMDEYLASVEDLMDLYDEIGDEEKALYYESILEQAEAEEDAFFAFSSKAKKGDISFDSYIKHKESIIAYIKSLRRESDYDSSLYAMFTTAIGSYYLEMGDWKKAEENLLDAKNIYHKIKDSLKYELSIDLLGVLYKNMGDYQKAEKCFMGSKKSMQALGLLYSEMGEYQKAEQYLLQVLKESKEKYGVHHENYALMQNNLGETYLRMHDYKKAEKYLTNAFKFYEDSAKAGNLAIRAHCLRNLGELYLHTHNYQKAEQYLSDALKIHKVIHGENHPDYIAAMNNLGEVYFQTHDYQKAETCFIRSRDSQKKSFIHTVDFMSELQRSRYWETVKERYERQYPKFCYRYQVQKPSIASFAYDNELYTKGLLLSSSNAIRQSVLESQDSALIQDWEYVMNLRNKLNYMQKKGSALDSLTLIEQFAEEMEKVVTKASVEYRENIRQWNITWDSVKAELKPNQVAIEYMKALLTDDSTMYCALLVRDTSSYPILIPLFEEKEMSQLRNISGSAAITRTYSYDGDGKELYRLVWEKVLPYIRPGETVFFAPTGVLHQLAIENLPVDAARTMKDVYQMVRLSSTRELALHKSVHPHKQASLYGGIHYEQMDSFTMRSISDKYRQRDIAVSYANDATQRALADYLPATKDEVDSIQTILASQQIRVQVYSNKEACEESVKALSGTHPNIVHLATHGFYWSESTAHNQQYFSQYEAKMDDQMRSHYSIDPLERCGLLFAGANTALSGHVERLPEGVQDGILTAKEISTMDLRDADIVVLSACETGLGDISGEGVFGLQRAFKMAGVQTILMALWKVDDEATRILMTAFYRHMNEGETKREAFRHAQQEVRNYKGEDNESENRTIASGKEKMLNKGKLSSGSTQPSTVANPHPFASPYYWAGFILLD